MTTRRKKTPAFFEKVGELNDAYGRGILHGILDSPPPPGERHYYAQITRSQYNDQYRAGYRDGHNLRVFGSV